MGCTKNKKAAGGQTRPKHNDDDDTTTTNADEATMQKLGDEASHIEPDQPHLTRRARSAAG